MRKRIPKGRVRRSVFLDRDSLYWALGSMQNDQRQAERDGDCSDTWRKRFETAERHLQELIHAAEHR